MTDRQDTFDFSRGDQLGLLRECQLPAVRVRGGASVSGSVQKSVLKQIDDFGGGRLCYAGAATIAAKIQRHRKTVQRAIAALQANNVLAVVRQYQPAAGKVLNHYRILYQELESFVPGGRGQKPAPEAAPKRDLPVVEKGADQRDIVSDQRDIVSDQRDTVPPHSKRPLSAKGNAHSPPTPPRRGDGDASAWDAIARRLIEAGVREWHRALDTVQHRGLSQTHVEQILQHFARTPGAYGAVALYARLMRAHADLPPEEGWPEPRRKAHAPIAASPQRTAERIRNQVVKEGRRRHAPPEVILDVLRRRLADAGIEADRYCLHDL